MKRMEPMLKAMKKAFEHANLKFIVDETGVCFELPSVFNGKMLTNVFSFAKLDTEAPIGMVEDPPISCKQLNYLFEKIVSVGGVLDKLRTCEIKKDQLTKQRDEARREVCETREYTVDVGVLSREDAAQNRGWDDLYPATPKSESDDEDRGTE